MKTAEEILDGYISVDVITDYDFYEPHYHKGCVLKAMEEYRLQSHPSPMSAEQVELLEASKIALHTLDCIEFTRDQGTASKRLETAISKLTPTPSVKADGWVSVEECKKREQDAYNDGYNTGLSHGKPIGY